MARRAAVLLSAVVLVTGVITFLWSPLDRGGDDRTGARISYTVRGPIMIMGDTDFTAVNGVTGGTGTASDPFIIENWEIDATGTMTGIYVMMTTKHYVIRQVHVYGDDVYGVTLYQAPHGTVQGSLFDRGALGMIAIESS